MQNVFVRDRKNKQNISSNLWSLINMLRKCICTQFFLLWNIILMRYGRSSFYNNSFTQGISISRFSLQEIVEEALQVYKAKVSRAAPNRTSVYCGPSKFMLYVWPHDLYWWQPCDYNGGSYTVYSIFPHQMSRLWSCLLFFTYECNLVR